MRLNFENCTIEEAVDKLCTKYGVGMLREHLLLLGNYGIKRGKEDIGYEELVKLISGTELTYLPALLTHVVQQCVERKVFVRGGLLRLVERAAMAMEKYDDDEAPQPAAELVVARPNVRVKVKPGIAIKCECGGGHAWYTKAVAYGESWKPRAPKCPICKGVYLVAGVRNG